MNVTTKTDFHGDRRGPRRTGGQPAGLRRTDPAGRLGAQAGALAGHRHAAAHQARPRSDRARPPYRAHGGAQQDAPVAGSRPYRDLPDRRLHQHDRRPVRSQHHPPAADARTDRGQRADLLPAGVDGARSGAHRDPLQQRMERSAGRARHDRAGGALHGGAHDGARRLRQAVQGGPLHQRARVPVPADAGVRQCRAQVRSRARRHRPEVQPAGGAPSAGRIRAGAAMHPDDAAARGARRRGQDVQEQEQLPSASAKRRTPCSPRC